MKIKKYKLSILRSIVQTLLSTRFTVTHVGIYSIGYIFQAHTKTGAALLIETALRQLSLHTLNTKFFSLLKNRFVLSHFSPSDSFPSPPFLLPLAVLESIFHPKEWNTSSQGTGNKNKTARHLKPLLYCPPRGRMKSNLLWFEGLNQERKAAAALSAKNAFLSAHIDRKFNNYCKSPD